MRPTTLAFLLLAASLAPRAPLAAQGAASVAVGDRVRITTPTPSGPQRYIGNVVGVQSDSLTVRTASADTKAVAVADITRLEVSTGKHGNGRRGMLYGTLVGAGVGAIAGAATYQKPSCAGSTWFCDTGRGADAFAGGLVGGVLGLAVGGIWGATHPTERWSRRALGTTHVGLLPSAHGAALTLSARF